MADLQLNSTGDIDWENISLTEGNSESVAQKLRITLRRYLGEWFLNINKGVPYFQSILIKGVTKEFVDTLFIDEIVNTQGVLRVVEYVSDITPEGVYVAAFTAETTEGELFNFNVNPIELG